MKAEIQVNTKQDSEESSPQLGLCFFLNDLVRFVPTLGSKDKVFMVPMIHLHLVIQLSREVAS
jgi:hypothetical protein